MTTKTILHIIDTTGPGGAETVFIQLADMLRTRGWRSLVVIRGPGWVQEELERRGLRPIIIPSRGSFAFKFLKSLIRLIKKEKVDVIQSHLLGSNVYSAIAGLFTRVPVVATYHGMVDVDPNERFRWLKHKAMEKGIQRYVAVSQRLLQNIQSRGLLDIQRSSVIYNGVDVSRYGRTDKKALRGDLQLNDDALFIGSLGNIRPAKDYPNLIAAGAMLIKALPTVHFVIAGHQKPSLMTQLDAQMQALGVSNHFHFLGFCQDCAEFLGQVDVFALSSSSEGFSIATIEAMATGLPVVVTQCGGPEEIVIPEENGLMVAPGDPHALSEALKRVISDNALAQQLAIAGRDTAKTRFSLEEMLTGYEKLYNDVIR